MERQSLKEQLTARYSKLKKKIFDWETAIYKTDGRKANKDDMKTAPKDVQESYRDLVKIRKYLENGCPETPKKDVGTPGKIFLGKHRQQLGRSDRSYLTTPARKHPPKAPSKPKASAPTLGLRSSGKNSLTVNAATIESNNAPQQFTFKKLFNLSAGGLKTDNKKPHKTVTVKEDNNKLVERKVLVPSRFSLLQKRSSEIFEPGTNSEKAVANHTADSFEEDDYIVENPFKKKQEKDNIAASSTDLDGSVSKPEIKSPIAAAKTKLSFRTSRQLDTGWLARLEEDDENFENKEINESSTRFSVEAEDTSSSDHGCPKSPAAKAILHDDGNDGSFGEAVMDVDVDFTNESTLQPPPITFDNSDSGICVFNSEDVYQAVEEVLAETRPNNSQNADESLLCSYSEDACLPSDSDFLNHTDKNAISDIIKSLSDSVSEGEELKLPESCSSDGLNSNTRKRKPSVSFSPSPEKPMQKRKFFKSSRTERIAKYSLNSYKPPSPLKKIKGAKSNDSAKKPETPVTTTPRSRITRSKTEESVKLPNINIKSNSEEVPQGSASAQLIPNLPKSTRIAQSKRQTNNKEENGHDEIKPPRKTNTVVDAFDEAPRPMTISIKRRTKRQPTKLDQKGQLESKIANGKMNENYVRIDTKRKVFVRGHKKISVTKLKRLDWKNKKSAAGKGKDSFSTTTFSCHKCGEKGHFAKFCMKDTAEDECPAEQDDSPFPSLEEAARMIWTKSSSNTKKVNIYTNGSSQTQTQDVDSSNSDETVLKAYSEEPIHSMCLKLVESVDPFFSDENAPTGADQEFEEDVIQEGLKAFGYENFRPGQREAVSRVLNGLSTLLILSTGSGKSLCYQLPAYLYGKKYPGALTLCISPLVSLMEDQIQGIPPFLNAACLHSNMSAKQKSIVLDKVKAKQLHILLVSPESVCGGLFGLLKGTGDNLPTISFACIDEVHCVSQWSHNFRPSYLQLCKILREKLNVKTILGLTATATRTTAQSICEHLHIDPSTTIRGELIPTNLKLSVSRDVHKDEALVTLLHGDRFRECDSIIIYCTRRDECERIASFVRTQIQEISTHKVIKTKSRSRLSGNCEAYHAGMTPRRRKNVQEGFMSGNIRVVVATVAFGMGIDKSDIRAVIHYNMPSAFESYVQEIGRAGRDGLPAHCHLFLDSAKRNDLSELKRHVYANSVDRPTVRKLLRKVFRPCKCDKIEQLKGNSQPSENKTKACSGHEVSFSIEKTVLDLDLPQENITTLLCYLELDAKKWIDMLPLTYETCKIQSYGGPKVLKAAASRSPPLAAAIALLKEKKKFRETDSHLEFNVIETAATLGWNSGIVKKELKNLEWAGSQFDAAGNPTRFRKSGLMVEFVDLAYRVMSPGSMSDEEADEVLNTLHGRNVRQEQTQLYQLQRVYHALLSVSMPNVDNLCDSHDEDKSDALKKFIYEYFTEDNMLTSPEFNLLNETETDNDKIEDLRHSIRHLVDSCGDTHFTTRAIAKIFQGIPSPCFPSDVWYRNRDFWRKYMDVDFHVICRIAAEEL